MEAGHLIGVGTRMISSAAGMSAAAQAAALTTSFFV
jgi:hypothetical protein